MEHNLETHYHHKFITKKVKESESVHASIELTNVANTMFIGELSVGTEEGNNKFEVIFDTGSALTCIASE